MNYEIVTLFEVYLVDGGGMGHYVKNIGFYTSYDEAEKVLKTDYYSSMQALLAIKIDGKYFPLNTTIYNTDSLPQHSKYRKWQDSEFTTAEPVQVNNNTLNQQEHDNKRRKELLNNLSVDDMRILGLKNSL